MVRPTALVLCFVLAPAALAQQPPSTPQRTVAYDVVSVKRNTEQSSPARFNSSFTQRPDGGVLVVNMPVGTVIGRAYGIRPFDMVGLPGWALSIDERYDVTATASLPDATAAERAAMLQAMLADRFKLAVHFEKREQATYDLVLARKDRTLGQGLKPVESDCDAAERAAIAVAAGAAPPPRPGLPDFKAPPPPCTFRIVQAAMRDRLGDGKGALGDLLEGEGTIGMLTRALLVGTTRPVIDKTGLAGTYRVTMNFDSVAARRGPDLAPPENAGPSVFSAVQEQLGLKLESSRTVTDTLVIDRLERPTEN
jgi:uncharacterized protein (TIGR03435 family)